MAELFLRRATLFFDSIAGDKDKSRYNTSHCLAETVEEMIDSDGSEWR